MMTSLHSIGGSFIYITICLVSLGLVTGQLFVLMQAIRRKRSRGFMIPAVLNLLLGLCLFIVMMDCSMSFIYSPEDALLIRPFQHKLFDVPWIVYAVIELICAAILIWHLYSDRRFRRNHLTPDAIRQTLDLLPAGICISDDKGTVLLSNLKMNEICRELTGHILSDADHFMKQVEATGDKQSGSYYVKMTSGTVCRFERKPLTESGKQYNCLTAIDVTERYCVTEELKVKNEHLQEVKRRMQAVSELTGDMFVAQEEASARAALHNQLGQVLLMGRHYLNHPESTDAKLVYLTTAQMNAFLLGEYSEPTEEQDDLLSQVFVMMQSIGVTVDVHGSLPEQAGHRTILAHAVQECAANTVKHAGGDRLTLMVDQSEEHIKYVITNNGEPPKAPIEESGGLLSLRRSIEETGGMMIVQSHPVFMLTIKLNN